MLVVGALVVALLARVRYVLLVRVLDGLVHVLRVFRLNGEVKVFDRSDGLLSNLINLYFYFPLFFCQLLFKLFKIQNFFFDD